MAAKLRTRELAALIQRHPDAIVILDNDSWWMGEADGETKIIDSEDVYPCGPYGRDILEALAYIVGLTIEDC